MILQAAICICLAIVHVQAQLNNAYEVICIPHTDGTKGKPGKIILNYKVENAITGATPAVSTALQAVNPGVGKCTSVTLTPAATVVCTAGTLSGLITPYTCIIDIEAAVANGDACGVSTTGTAPAQSSTFKMKLNYVAGTLQTIDAVLINTCDWSKDPTGGQVFPGAAQVTGTAPTITATVAGGVSKVTAEIWSRPKGSAASVVPTKLTGAAALGDELQVQLTVPAQHLQYLKATRMEADHKNDFSSADKLILLDVNCGKPPYMLKTTHFKFDTAKSSSVAPSRIYVTGGSPPESAFFPAFSFPAAAVSNEVFLGVTVKLSLTDQDTKDTDCTVRRKRDAPKGNDTEVSVVAQIYVYPSTGYANQKLSNQQDLSCLNTVSFLSVIAVLAVLLIVTIGFVIFFAVKATRSKTSDKESYPNPAYKA